MRRTVFIFIAVALTVALAPAAASAFLQTSSLTVVVKYDGKPLEKINISICKTADAHVQGDIVVFTATTAFSGAGADFSDMTTEKSIELAIGLNKYADEHGIARANKLTDIQGQVRFEDLSEGFYLVAQLDADESDYIIAPYLVCVPMNKPAGTGAGYDYDVVSLPKSEPSKKPAPSPEPSPTPSPAPSPLPSPSPSPDPSPGPSASPSPAPSPVLTPSPAPSLTPTPSQTPTPTPSQTPAPTPTPPPSFKPGKPQVVLPPPPSPSKTPAPAPSAAPSSGPEHPPSQQPQRTPEPTPARTPIQLPSAPPARAQQSIPPSIWVNSPEVPGAAAYITAFISDWLIGAGPFSGLLSGAGLYSKLLDNSIPGGPMPQKPEIPVIVVPPKTGDDSTTTDMYVVTAVGTMLLIIGVFSLTRGKRKKALR